MNIKTIPSKYDTVITSDNKNEFRYSIIPEELIKTWQQDPDVKSMTLPQKSIYINRMMNASRIKIYTSFDITSPMADLAEQSKILTVEHRNNGSIKYFTIIPHPMFSYEKLNNVLNDIFIKFGL